MSFIKNVLCRYFSGYRGLERRDSPRRRMIVTAWVKANRTPLPMVAVLWDISRSGARLAVADPQALPDKFELLFSRNDTRSKTCRIVWRSRQQVGVHFATPLDPEAIALAYNGTPAT